MTDRNMTSNASRMSLHINVHDGEQDSMHHDRSRPLLGYMPTKLWTGGSRQETGPRWVIQLGSNIGNQGMRECDFS